MGIWSAHSLSDLQIGSEDTLNLDSLVLPLRADVKTAEYTRDETQHCGVVTD
jgi:hypothetical protein